MRGRFTIRSLEDGLEDFQTTWKAVQEGLPVTRRAGKSFTSLDLARKVLTPKRLELLRVIRRRQPESVSRLARLLGRDLKHVTEDVDTLLRYGLLSLSMKKAISGRQVSTPTVPFEEIELRIPV